MPNNIVSIVIPCYNMGSYVKETIHSVSDYNDASKIEIIIVNDGSTEKYTLKVFDELEKEGFFVLHQKNKGLSCARNNGIKLAKGGYIIPLDADNKLRKEFIDLAISLFKENPQFDILYSDAAYFGEKTGNWIVGEFNFPKLLTSNYIDACACFRKEVWGEIGGYDEKMVSGSEDWDFWLRAYLKGFKFKYIDEVLFDYRVRNNSMVVETRKKGHEISNYMFQKEELKFLKDIRNQLIRLKNNSQNRISEPSMNEIFNFIYKKIKRKFKILF